jgi:5'-AMP-activated protein kinase catalytic alpha subunit
MDLVRSLTNPVTQATTPVAGDAAKISKISDYTIGSHIGQGAYAVVKNGVHKASSRKVAIKIYEKYRIADTQRKNCVNREIKILKRLNHCNIVQLYETIDTTKQLFLIMELVKGRSLYSYVHSKPNKRLDESECMKIFSQVVAGIEYCHKNNIVNI